MGKDVATKKQISDIAKQIAEQSSFAAPMSDDEEEEEESEGSEDDDDEEDEDEDSDEEANVSDEQEEDEGHDSNDNDQSEEENVKQKPTSKKRPASESSTKPTPAPKKPRVDDPEDTTIFVGNLSWDTDEKSLIAFFEAAGKVNGVRLISGPDGKKKGFGYVEFADSASARKGLEFAGQELDGRTIKTDRSTPIQVKKGPDTQECDSLFIGNLSVNATVKSLKELFGKHGKVTEVRIPLYPDSGNPKGFAYISFSTTDAAKAALEELHGHEFEGRKLRLDYSTPLKNVGVRHSFKHGRGGSFRGRGRGGAAASSGGSGGGRGGEVQRGGRGGSGLSSSNSGGGRGASSRGISERGGRGRGGSRGASGRGGRGGPSARGGRGASTGPVRGALTAKPAGKKTTFE